MEVIAAESCNHGTALGQVPPRTSATGFSSISDSVSRLSDAFYLLKPSLQRQIRAILPLVRRERAHDLAEIDVRHRDRHVLCREVRGEHIKRRLFTQIQRRIRQVAALGTHFGSNHKIASEQVRNRALKLRPVTMPVRPAEAEQSILIGFEPTMAVPSTTVSP